MATYRGYSFPFRPVGGVFPARSEDETLLAQALIQLIGTRRGERVMRPDFGTRIYDFLFENNDEVLQELVRADVMSAIGTFEPRVLVSNITIERKPDEGLIDVKIEYVVRLSSTLREVTVSFPTT